MPATIQEFPETESPAKIEEFPDESDKGKPSLLRRLLPEYLGGTPLPQSQQDYLNMAVAQPSTTPGKSILPMVSEFNQLLEPITAKTPAAQFALAVAKQPGKLVEGMTAPEMAPLAVAGPIAPKLIQAGMTGLMAKGAYDSVKRINDWIHAPGEITPEEKQKLTDLIVEGAGSAYLAGRTGADLLPKKGAPNARPEPSAVQIPRNPPPGNAGPVAEGVAPDVQKPAETPQAQEAAKAQVAEISQPAVKSMPDDKGNIEYFPAEKKKDGTWETHDEIIKRNKLEASDVDRRVFLDENGKEKSREQTASQVEAVGGTTKITGEAHSTDVNKLTKASPNAPKEPAPAPASTGTPSWEAPVAGAAKEPFDFGKAGREARANFDSAVAAVGDATGIEMRSPKYPNMRVLITKDPSEPGKWRATRVDQHGPAGHNVYDSKEEAISDYTGGHQTAGPSWGWDFKVVKTSKPDKVSSGAEAHALSTGESTLEAGGKNPPAAPASDVYSQTVRGAAASTKITPADIKILNRLESAKPQQDQIFPKLEDLGVDKKTIRDLIKRNLVEPYGNGHILTVSGRFAKDIEKVSKPAEPPPPVTEVAQPSAVSAGAAAQPGIAEGVVTAAPSQPASTEPTISQPKGKGKRGKGPSPDTEEPSYHVATYGGKDVFVHHPDPKAEFKMAAQRVRDNLKAGEKGYVTTPEGKTYEISRESRMAKPVENPAPPEVQPAAAKAEAEVQRVAKTEGQRPAKEVKSELVARLEDSIEKAPSEKSIPISEETGLKLLPKDVPERIDINIPGDGNFNIINTKEALQTVRDRAKTLSTNPNEPQKITRRGASKEDRAWVEEQLKAQPPPSAGLGPEHSMGGATPSEFAPSGNTPTGIKNSTVDTERAKRGLPPAIQPLKRSFGEVWDRAMAMIDHDPGVVDNLLESLRSKPRALTDTEDALLLHRQVDLQNEYGKATRDLAQAHDDGRTEAAAEEKLRVARLSDQLLDLYNIGKRVGTETGRGLAARKMMANEDFSLAQMELDKRAANGGRPLTDQQRAEITALHEKIASTQKAYDEHVARMDEKLAASEAARKIAELQAKTAPTFDKRILAQAESIVSKMEAAAKPAADRLRERLMRMSAGVDPTIVYDAAIVGSAKIARLGLDLAKFTDEMVRDFGEKLRPMMADIWAEANKMVDANTAKAPDAVKRVVKKAGLDEIKKATAENVKDKIAKGQKDKISWQVQNLAREFVKSGITDREALIDAVHGVLRDADPAITRRQAMDMISGYGDYKQLSKDATTVQLRGMKGEMQQLAKLEDMAKGEPPLKSGVERRTPTEAERKLIKEVNDAKNKFQVPVSDPETQLKSALDTLKTTLQNRIADYQDRIARGDYAPRPRRSVELDATASRLKAENERVKKQFQRGVALDRLKNRTQVERGADLITKWRRGFILSGPVTLAKLTSAAAQRMSFTPVEEALGGAIGKAIPGVAEKAPREGGFNVRAEAKAVTQAVTQGMVDAWKVLRTGQSDLDILYGKEALLPPSAVDFFGHVHGALKAPTKRAEFARSFEKRTQHAIAQGVDVSDPMVQSRLVIEAYKDANRAIFQQDNRVVTAYKRGLQALEAKDKATGEVPLGGKALATTARVLLPIVKIPTNIVAETMQYATGSVTGSLRLARAFSWGIENLKPEEADLIMRSLKKGSIGAAVMALGYFNPQVIGGYYQAGEKRKPSDVKAGMVRLYGMDIPSFLLHNPLLETLQIGATARRVADSKLRKKDTDQQGLPAGIIAAGIGLGEEVPFVRESVETAKALNPHERGAFFGELGKSLVVPQLLQWTAQHYDVDAQGRPIKRKPKTAIQRIELGIPGLRQQVPTR